MYLLPAAAAAILAGASVWAVLRRGCAVLLLVLCFAEAGELLRPPGGAYLYTRAAFGDFVGFEVGWMTWIARIASVAVALRRLRPGAELLLARRRGRLAQALAIVAAAARAHR